MSNDIDYVIIKNHRIKTSNIKQLARQIHKLAFDLRLGFDIKIDGKVSCIESEEMDQDNEKIEIMIESWYFKFERKKNTKEYQSMKIEINHYYDLALKWRDIGLLNTIIMMTNGEMLWVAIDEGWYGYMYKIEKEILEAKEFPFYEVLKEGIIWGDKFKDAKNVKHHFFQEEYI